MLPEAAEFIIPSEIAATGSAPQEVDENNNYLDTNTTLESYTLTPLTSSYLQRIPSGSRHWEMYLADLLDAKAKRSSRERPESITDFLLRFPIEEIS